MPRSVPPLHDVLFERTETMYAHGVRRWREWGRPHRQPTDFSAYSFTLCPTSRLPSMRGNLSTQTLLTVVTLIGAIRVSPNTFSALPFITAIASPPLYRPYVIDRSRCSCGRSALSNNRPPLHASHASSRTRTSHHRTHLSISSHFVRRPDTGTPCARRGDHAHRVVHKYPNEFFPTVGDACHVQPYTWHHVRSRA